MDMFNGVVNDFCWGLQCFVLVDVVYEVFQYMYFLMGVGYFWVELYVVEVFFFVGYNGEWVVVGVGDGYEVCWDGGYFVVVVYLYVQQWFVVCGQGIFDIVYQCVVVNYFNLCVIKFMFVRIFYMVVQLYCYGLYVVVDVKYWYVGFEYILWCVWVVFFGGVFWVVGKNDVVWIKFVDLCFCDILCLQFIVDVQFMYVMCYQLSILRFEVEDEDVMFMNVFCY